MPPAVVSIEKRNCSWLFQWSHRSAFPNSSKYTV